MPGTSDVNGTACASEHATIPPAHYPMNWWVRFLTLVYEQFRIDQLSLRARGLTYTTLLSLVPFLAVMFSVLKAFGVQSQLEPTLVRMLDPLGPQGRELSHRIVEFVNTLDLGVLGAVGVAGLFYTTISLISESEDALNAIWRARRARSWGRKFSDYLSVILVGPMLVFTGFALTASAQSHWLVQHLLAIRPVGALVVLVTRIMPLVLLWAAFTFLYRVLPCTRVRLTSALIGGLMAGVLWHVVGSGFALFVLSSTRYTAIYSSFAILILFLLWLYISWLIVLLGAEVSYLHQYRAYDGMALAGHNVSPLFRERLALSTLVEVTRRHLEGRPPCSATELAACAGVSLLHLEDMIDELSRPGLLLRTAAPEGIVLGRAPDMIAISDIFTLLRGSDTPVSAADERDPQSWVLHRRREAVDAALHGVTLRTLAERTPKSDTQLPSHDHADEKRDE